MYSNNPIIEGRYDAYGRKTYWDMGYRGQGVKVAVIDDYGTSHGHQMASVGAYVAPDAEVIKLDMRGSGQGICDMLYEAIKQKSNIVSLSRYVEGDTKDLHDAVIACRNAGIVIFCSAGNQGEKQPYSNEIIQYPAAYPETITVMALENNFTVQKSSSRSSTGWCTGFGQNVLVKNAAGEEMLVDGTSPTTPACAFTLALHWSKVLKETGKHPCPADMEQFVISHCVDWGKPGKDNFTGYGFFTLDPRELKRVKLMILDADKDGLEERVDRIKAMVKAGSTLEDAEAQVSKDYFIVTTELLNGSRVNVYGGRKPM